MAETRKQYLARRAAERAHIRAIEASGQGDHIYGLLMGADTCRWCDTATMRRDLQAGGRYCTRCGRYDDPAAA